MFLLPRILELSLSLCLNIFLCRFHVVFNTLGAVVHESCLRFCDDDGIVVTTVATKIASDSYGFIFGALYALWVRIQCLIVKV